MADKSPINWTAAVTEHGELHSAFVRGHVDLSSLPDAAEQIVAAFTRLDAETGEMVSEAFDGEPVHETLAHFWLIENDDLHYFAREDDIGAFAVTGVRFL